MTFDEWVRTAVRVSNQACVECPQCGQSFLGAVMFDHLWTAHDLPHVQCPCGEEMLNSWSQNLAHFKSFQVPSDHVREMLVLQALRSGNGVQ